MRNLKKQSTKDLRALLAQVKKVLAYRMQQEARAEILDIAKAAGFGVTKVAEAIKPARGHHLRPKGVVRYRHPDNRALQWSGFGRPPNWVLAWQREYGSRLGIINNDQPGDNGNEKNI